MMFCVVLYLNKILMMYKTKFGNRFLRIIVTHIHTRSFLTNNIRYLYEKTSLEAQVLMHNSSFTHHRQKNFFGCLPKSEQ